MSIVAPSLLYYSDQEFGGMWGNVGACSKVAPLVLLVSGTVSPPAGWLTQQHVM